MLDAYRLLQAGAEALSVVERQGICVDVEYCRERVEWLDRKIAQAHRRLGRTKLGVAWRARFGESVNHNSGPQLRAVLYADMGVKPFKQTQTNDEGSIDEESLRQVDVEGIDHLLSTRRHKKMRDVLAGFLRYQLDGVIYPSYPLHTVATYRSCVARGTKVLAARDFLTHPGGVPIELIRAGDYVYCFDDDLRPALRRVLWSGKTGHRRVVRVHWVERAGHGRGYLDVTPEHLIRLIDGSYVKARHLDGADFRKPHESRRLPKVRTLSCSRVGDHLRFTGHLKNNNGIQEHRFIYQNLVGPLDDEDVVHHVNENHLDHRPDNLEKLSKSAHAKLHVVSNLTPDRQRRGYLAAIERGRREGFPWIKRGADNHRWVDIPRFAFLRTLARAKGKPTKVNLDYEMIMSRCRLFGIDIEHVRDRYDRDGDYITLGRLKGISPISLGKMSRNFGLNYGKSRRMLGKRGIGFIPSGPCRNPYGRRGGPLGNHTITGVEWLDGTVDVYDIEVEGVHNFIANEICVHNSSSDPNMQNVQKRDKEAMEVCRRAIKPRPGHGILEVDFSGLEVSVAATYHQDPRMIEYLCDPTSDMHADMATEIYRLPLYNRRPDGFGTLRQSAKNGFVFPEFYGDYYESCAYNVACLWCRMPRGGVWRSTDGIEYDGRPIGSLMRANGIKSYDDFVAHMRAIEDDFWNRRFRVYNKWRRDWYAEYQRTGGFEMKTGFRVAGLLSRNQVINYPVQGSAFHCLLQVLIWLVERMRGWRSKVIGEVHDSALIDFHPDEFEEVVALCRRLATVSLAKAWDWIIVPLRVEVQRSAIDGNWAEMEVVP